jgi:Protein of unknown function (DUF3999)
MKSSAAFFLLASTAVAPQSQYFAYERLVQGTPDHAAQTCVVLDEELFAHATPELGDLRLYHDGKEAPYAIQLDAPAEAAATSVPVLNAGERDGKTEFDASMPEGSFRDVQLSVTGEDFLATVTVSGRQTQTESSRTRLGSYTIFDLTHQKLGRSTMLHLPVSDFRFLHFSIEGPLSPQSFTGVSIEKLRMVPPRYEMVATASGITQKGYSTVVEFSVPGHVPVDRVAFAIGPLPPNFSRDVSVKVAPSEDVRDQPERFPASGNLLRIHRVTNGHHIDEERLAIDVQAVAADRASRWTATIDNGDDPPLNLESAQLQMLRRSLCFEAAGSGRYTLRYGDAALKPARYDYASLFSSQADAVTAVAMPEQRNPEYRPRPDQRPLTERHPGLLWAALLLVLALLAVLAFRSATARPAS